MRKMVSLMVGVVLLLNGCRRAPEAAPTPMLVPVVQQLQPGDPVRGEKLFRQTLIGSKPEPGCITCHSLQPDVVLVGPSMAGIGARAATITKQTTYLGKATTRADYLRESILTPNAYLVEGFAPHVMRTTFAAELSAQQVEDLVAYLSTLETQP